MLRDKLTPQPPGPGPCPPPRRQPHATTPEIPIATSDVSWAKNHPNQPALIRQLPRGEEVLQRYTSTQGTQSHIYHFHKIPSQQLAENINILKPYEMSIYPNCSQLWQTLVSREKFQLGISIYNKWLSPGVFLRIICHLSYMKSPKGNVDWHRVNVSSTTCHDMFIWWTQHIYCWIHYLVTKLVQIYWGLRSFIAWNTHWIKDFQHYTSMLYDLLLPRWRIWCVYGDISWLFHSWMNTDTG